MNSQTTTGPLRSRHLMRGGAISLIVALCAGMIVTLRGIEDSGAPPVLAAIVTRRADTRGNDSSSGLSRPETATMLPAKSSNPLATISSDSLRERLLGSWFLERHGRRTLMVKPDGTATADVQLDTIGAFMYGAQLRLELTWSLDDDVMTQVIEGGTPADAVRRLARDWGDRRDYRVIRVSADELVLAEVDDEADQQVWQRVAAAKDTASSAEVSQASATKQSPR